MYTYMLKPTKQWITKLYKTNESGTIISLPDAGVRRTVQSTFEALGRLNQLETIDLKFINLLPKNSKIITEQINSSINEDTKFLYIRNLNLDLKNHQQFIELLSQILDNQKTKINCIFSVNIDPRLSKNKFNHPLLLKNFFYFPYCRLESLESSQLIGQNTSRFEIKLPIKLQKNLFNLTNGCPGLIKESFKYYKDNQTLPTYQALKTKIDEITFSLPVEIINLIKHLPHVNNKPLYTSLTKLNLLPLGQLLKESLSRATANCSLQINPKKETISILFEDVTNQFTPSEKQFLFKLFSAAKLSRERCAEIFFGSGKSFTDYALDQRISRLRRKLTKLGANPNIIKTDKKYGYSFSS